MSLEIKVNPFLRCDIPSVRVAAETHAGKPLPNAFEVFAVLRAWKDEFR
jgi:hydroxyacylglutathione hydrolase